MTAQVVHFVKPPQVRALSSQVFTKREVAQAFETPETKIETAASRFGMFLVSEPLVGATRHYHYLDALALLVWLSFDRQWGPSGRKTLTSQVSHLLFGEHVTAEEYRARRAETRKQYDKAVETPRGRPNAQDTRATPRGNPRGFLVRQSALVEPIRRCKLCAFRNFAASNYNRLLRPARNSRRLI
jgi:hypothetical protein